MPCAQEVGTKQLGGVEIACVEMGEVPQGRVRAPFLAVGDWNGTVKILGLSPENLLEQVGLFIYLPVSGIGSKWWRESLKDRHSLHSLTSLAKHVLSGQSDRLTFNAGSPIPDPMAEQLTLHCLRTSSPLPRMTCTVCTMNPQL